MRLLFERAPELRESNERNKIINMARSYKIYFNMKYAPKITLILFVNCFTSISFLVFFIFHVAINLYILVSFFVSFFTYTLPDLQYLKPVYKVNDV